VRLVAARGAVSERGAGVAAVRETGAHEASTVQRDSADRTPYRIVCPLPQRLVI
jgi:hypothetical protein